MDAPRPAAKPLHKAIYNPVQTSGLRASRLPLNLIGLR